MSINTEGAEDIAERCGSVKFLNSSPSLTDEKTVLVFGCGRGGTSAVSGGLRLLGVNMPNAHPLKHEWSPVCFLNGQIDRHATRENILCLNNQYSVWGWKAPKDIFYIDQYLSMIRNPHIVIVFRNILDVLNSNASHEKIDFVASAIDTSDVYTEICRLITFTCFPVALINYEKMLVNSFQTFKALNQWLNLKDGDDSISKAENFTKVEPGRYNAIQGSPDNFIIDAKELALDQAQAQLQVYSKRTEEFLDYNQALLEDLRKACEIKNNLERKIAEIRYSEYLADRASGVKTEYTLKHSEVSNNVGYVGGEMSESKSINSVGELSYYISRDQYIRTFRQRILIQADIDSLDAEIEANCPSTK